MQLFRSEWLREPRYIETRDASVRGCGMRYGVRVEHDFRRHRLPVSAPEMVGMPLVERERAVLWDIARYDRAA